MANRKTIADILAGYEVAKSIISYLNQEAYLNALVAGLNLGVNRRVGEPIVRRGPCMESVHSNDHRGTVAGLVPCRNEELTLGVIRIRLCTQFDRRPTKQRALCNSICRICRNHTIESHKTHRKTLPQEERSNLSREG